MKTAFQAVLAIIIAVGFSTALGAKGATSRISISGGNLGRPIDIRNEAVLEAFQIWSGPGTSSCASGQCVEGTEGFIVDWSAGAVVARPSGLPRYQIAFFVQEGGVGGQPAPERLAYVVLYEYDSARAEGFVYLPGKGDQWQELNWGSIYRHGLEGGWFRATRAWQDAVVPLISQR
ncbi:MAG TPA: hypothetical protein VGY48_29015 [Vicinamibacterales bacterium]|jgi:hypothetical protein|nr:hypothetical protein [Vicinamibacterales bacterium]